MYVCIIGIISYVEKKIGATIRFVCNRLAGGLHCGPQNANKQAIRAFIVKIFFEALNLVAFVASIIHGCIIMMILSISNPRNQLTIELSKQE